MFIAKAAKVNEQWILEKGLALMKKAIKIKLEHVPQLGEILKNNPDKNVVCIGEAEFH